jgi:hypothetical protein
MAIPVNAVVRSIMDLLLFLLLLLFDVLLFT